MNFTITRPNLQQAISAVASCLAPKASLPVLANILVETVDGGVRVGATDLDNWVRTTAPADVKESGAVTVPGKTLQDLAGVLADAPVSIQVQGEQLDVNCGRSRVKINGLPASEFPSLPEVDFEQGWSVQGQAVQELVERTSFAAATEETRPLLNGVLWELREDEMSMVATNGHRLARTSVKVDFGGSEAKDFIVPPAGLRHAQRLFKEAEAEIQVAVGGNYLGFRHGKTEVYSRLFEGTYPNYKQVIPKDNDRVALVEREGLERTMKRMAVMTTTATKKVKLSFAPERLHLNVTTPDLGEAHDELDIEYSGEPLEIAFNADYLLDLLKAIPGDEVKMAFKTSERAAVIEPASEVDFGYLSLVMPLHQGD